jgi:hypothetical protein
MAEKAARIVGSIRFNNAKLHVRATVDFAHGGSKPS